MIYADCCLCLWIRILSSCQSEWNCSLPHTTGFTPHKHARINLSSETLPVLRWRAAERECCLFCNSRCASQSHVWSTVNSRKGPNTIISKSSVRFAFYMWKTCHKKICCRRKHKQMYISQRTFKEDLFWKENTELSTLVPQGAEIKRVIVRLRSRWYADSHESSAVPVASCKFIFWILWNHLNWGGPFFNLNSRGCWYSWIYVYRYMLIYWCTTTQQSGKIDFNYRC